MQNPPYSHWGSVNAESCPMARCFRFERNTYDDGVTKNIGVNYYTDDKPVWLSGPDMIASKLLSGKVPYIEEAIRMVPHSDPRAFAEWLKSIHANTICSA